MKSNVFVFDFFKFKPFLRMCSFNLNINVKFVMSQTDFSQQRSQTINVHLHKEKSNSLRQLAHYGVSR